MMHMYPSSVARKLHQVLVLKTCHTEPSQSCANADFDFQRKLGSVAIHQLPWTLFDGLFDTC